jgi:hypothetical protein
MCSLISDLEGMFARVEMKIRTKTEQLHQVYESKCIAIEKQFESQQIDNKLNTRRNDMIRTLDLQLAKAENEHHEQMVELHEKLNEKHVGEYEQHEEQSEAEKAGDLQLAKAENDQHEQKEELHEKLNEKHVGEYQQHEEQSEAEKAGDLQLAKAENEQHEQKEEFHEKLNEKHVGEYQQHEEQSEAENLDFEENILIAILNKYENHSKEMIQSKRKHITPSCSREQIAKKQTIDY